MKQYPVVNGQWWVSDSHSFKHNSTFNEKLAADTETLRTGHCFYWRTNECC